MTEATNLFPSHTHHTRRHDYPDSHVGEWVAAVDAEISANPYAEKPPMLVEISYMEALREAEKEHPPGIMIPEGMSLDEIADYATEQAVRLRVAKDFLVDTEIRLGKNYLGKFAELTDAQKVIFIERFEGANRTLPDRHPRYERTDEYHHAHNHDESHSCRTIVPGMSARVGSWLEAKIGKRIENQRLKIALALGSRALMFAFCPGDDLAAIGMQTIGALKGHTGQHAHQHQEVSGILPRRPSIDFELGKATVSLPVDIPVTHNALPDTAAGEAVRKYTFDHQPAPEASRESQKPKARRGLQAAVAGFIAVVGLAGGLFAGEPKNNTKARGVPERPQAIQQDPTLPSKEPRPQGLTTECVTVSNGDSQWDLAARRIKEAVGREASISATNVVAIITAKANKATNPNPHQLRPGQCLQMPTAAATVGIYSALTDPAYTDTQLRFDLNELNKAPTLDGALAKTRTLESIGQSLAAVAG